MSLKTLLSYALIVISLVFTQQAAFAEDNYGAIAYCPNTSTYGYATNFATQEEAEEVALEGCIEVLIENEQEEEGKCAVQLWFKNAYGALAEGDNGFGTGWSVYRIEAQENALEKCHEYTENCDITLTIGTE